VCLQVSQKLLDNMYKGTLNLRLRRQKEVQEKSDLLANKDNIK
jgi:CTP-dependent riboflavin kinase